MTRVDIYVSWCFFIAMAAPVVFVCVYLTMPWTKTWEGRVLMFKQALWIGFLLDGVLYFALGPDWVGRDVMRVTLFTALPIALWGLTVLLIVRRRQSLLVRQDQRDVGQDLREVVQDTREVDQNRRESAQNRRDKELMN